MDYRNALKHFKLAIEINSDYADVHFNMAIVYKKMSMVNIAKRYCKEYHKIDPYSKWAEFVKEHLGHK